jgi:cleavage and polyadenylation specificity factor subunit 5
MSDWSVYESSNYDGVTLPTLKPKLGLVGEPKRSWMKRWMNEGMRRTVRAVFITHTDESPHVVIFRQLTGREPHLFLCGGKLLEGESEKEGLSRQLRSVILKDRQADSCEWKVGDIIAKYYRPEFDNRIYPYVPAHVTRPKEEITLIQVILPPRCVFGLREGISMSAIPVHEILKNPQAYPTLISALPQLISRFVLYNFVPGRPGFAPLPNNKRS